MSQIGVAKFISIVGLHFPRPKFEDDETMGAAWTASMTRTLGGYSDDVLLEAAQRILGTRNPKKDGKFFPVPSECSAVCDQVALLKSRTSSTPLLAGPSANEWSEERQRLALDLMKGPLGAKAAREGWMVTLYDFCRVNMRLPTEKEAAQYRESGRGFEEKLRDCENGEAGDNSRDWAKLGASIKARAKQYAEKVA